MESLTSKLYLRVIEEQSELFAEVHALKGIPQDEDHHPEGDAYVHTQWVLRAMFDIMERDGINDPRIYSILLNAALTHDLGKVSTTTVHEDGRITAYGHPDEGVLPAFQLLTRLGIDSITIECVLPLVREHMAWVGFYMSEITTRAVKRLARRLMPATIEMWALVVEADISGRPPRAKGLPERANEIVQIARELGINEGIYE